MRSADWDRSAATSSRTLSVLASDQVDPGGGNTDSISAGWFGALTKAYPKAVKVAGMGAGDTPSVLQPETKAEFAAEAQGWKVVDFLEPPTSVENWAPYVEQYQQKGVTALWPADDSNFTPFAQAMTTAGYHPDFVLLGTQFDNSQTQKDVAANPTPAPGLRRDAVVAARAGLAEPLDRRARHHHAQIRQG